MAKDPAILWYWNDWNGGTSTFTRHLKGCYIDLLSSQFNSGRLSLAEIKTVLGADFGQAWPSLQKKFRKDENGLFYNERMEQEQEKRKRFTESRRRNLESKQSKSLVSNHVAESMGNHMENVIENENTNEEEERGMGKEEGPVGLNPGGFLSDSLDKSRMLTELEVGASIVYIRIKTGKVIDRREILDQWEAFKIKQFSVKDYYPSWEKLLNHFRDSLKLELKNGNNTKKSVGKDLEFDRP